MNTHLVIKPCDTCKHHQSKWRTFWRALCGVPAKYDRCERQTNRNPGRSCFMSLERSFSAEITNTCGYQGVFWEPRK
jgi:hypothetical protein